MRARVRNVTSQTETSAGARTLALEDLMADE